MIDNLPNGWRIEELKNIGNFVRGVSYNKNDLIDELTENDITLLRANNIKEILYLKDFQFLNRKAVKEKQLLQYGDILIAMSSGSKDLVGKNVYIDRNLQNYSFGAFCSVFRTNPNKNSRYISLFFKSKYFKNSLSLNGTNINNLRITELECMKIPIPPLQQQEKIVKVLDLSSNLIEKQKELLKKYDLFLKSKFIEMFGNPSKNVMNWNIEKFEKYIEYIGDIGSNGSNAVISKNLKMLDTVDYALMIRTTNLNKNDFINDVKYVSEETYNFFKKSQIFGGEIIMNKIGSAGKFWKMPYLNKPVSLGLNQLVIRLKNLNTEYLYYLLSTEYGQLVISSKTNGAVTQSITKGAVKDIDIMIPPIELQNKFASIVEKIEIIKEKENQKLKQLEDLHNSLMQKAFNGEIE